MLSDCEDANSVEKHCPFRTNCKESDVLFLKLSLHAARHIVIVVIASVFCALAVIGIALVWAKKRNRRNDHHDGTYVNFNMMLLHFYTLKSESLMEVFNSVV